MNIFKKYCPNVWVAECDASHEKGEIITLKTQYGKDVEVEVFNLLKQGANGKFYYSIVRVESENYATRRARKYKESQALHARKSAEWHEKSQESADFLKLGEPIKVGHHSEKKHRALIERNWNRVGNAVKEQELSAKYESKVEYWENKAAVINLSMPESLEYFAFELEKAKAHHAGLKNGTIKRDHGYSIVYSNKAVKDLTQKLETAKILWG